MTKEQAKQLDRLTVEFSLAYLAVFDADGKSLYKRGTPTTPWCRNAISSMFGSDADAARTFESWAAQRPPGGGGVGDEGCIFFRPQWDIMVGAFFSGCERVDLGRKSKALKSRVLDILGAQPATAPNGGPATDHGNSGASEGPEPISPN